LLRLPGRKAVTLKCRYGSEQFAESYRAAVEGTAPDSPQRVAIKSGTVAAMARCYFNSASFATLALTTQRARRHQVEQFVAEHGEKHIATLKRQHVKAMLDAVADKPGRARNLFTVITLLVRQAIEDGLRTDDPILGIKRPRLRKGGWHTWDEAEIAQYEAHHPIGSSARLALALAIFTGQRRSDLVRMGNQHVRTGAISVVQQKTGAHVTIPLHPELQAILDATPSDHLTFLVTQRGKPFTPGGFTHRMRLWAREAGLKDVPLDGLRKAGCRRLAEVGCSAHEIMAISGHKTLAEVQRYCAEAEQKIRAERAIARTAIRTRAASRSHTEQKR
jgi:integrase